MEAIFALQADLEELAGRLLKASGEAGGSPEEGAEGLQELVTETAVALVEYKGLARESFMAVEECRCVPMRADCSCCSSSIAALFLP